MSYFIPYNKDLIKLLCPSHYIFSYLIPLITIRDCFITSWDCLLNYDRGHHIEHAVHYN